MLLLINEWQDSKVHTFEIELLVYTEKPQLDLVSGRECNSVEESLELINELHSEKLMHYENLTLYYNNKKHLNVRNQDDLINLINQSVLD